MDQCHQLFVTPPLQMTECRDTSLYSLLTGAVKLHFVKFSVIFQQIPHLFYFNICISGSWHSMEAMKWSLEAAFHASAILSLSIIRIPPLSLHCVLCLFSDAFGTIGRSRRTKLDTPSQSGMERVALLELVYIHPDCRSQLHRLRFWTWTIFL